MTRLLILLAVVTFICAVTAEVDIISEPRPGQEYVFVQTSGSGARPISRKEKATDAADRPFETAHKLPIALTFLREESEGLAAANAEGKIKEKREAAKEPSAAPPGSIKIDPKKLIEKYKSELQASSTKAPATSSTTKRTRTKKEAPVTTPASVLTTGAPATPRTLHIHDGSAHADDKLTASSSENKRSRIQIKKGPNGQEYEYEYVYYYYDDEEDEAGGAGSKINNNI